MDFKNDIINLIERDHQELKRNMDILLNTNVSIAKKRAVFKQFSILLALHSHAQENSIFAALKNQSLLQKIMFKDQKEHAIVEELIKDIESLYGSDNFWLAKIKMLLIIVENHIRIEESELLSQLKNKLDMETRIQIGISYNELVNKKIEDDKEYKNNEQGWHPPDDGFPTHSS